MYSILKKELNTFFGSITGYLVVIVFLLLTNAFLWILPNNYNIIDNGYATLNGLFELAPWLYLILIPAITMRLLAEEKKSGTMELLLTRPLSEWQIVMGKYIASLVVVLISLIPTLVSFVAVYSLSNPSGNMDVGGTLGSYLGLFFLAAIYSAIGLFCSAITSNQVVAFIYSVIFCFAIYLGFEYLDQAVQFDGWFSFASLGIENHYQSISRGVVDSRDLIYFVTTIFLLLWASTLKLVAQRFTKQLFKQQLIKFGAGLVFAIFISFNFFFRIDMTAEKRYTLSDVSKQTLNDIEEPIYVELYLGGELPVGFRNLRNAVVEKLQDMDAYSSSVIRCELINPYDEVSIKERKKYFQSLIKSGLKPTEIKRKSEDGFQTMMVFPSAVIRQGEFETSINLLHNNPMLHHEANLNHSIETLEYEIIRGIKRLQSDDYDRVAYLTGQKELDKWETMDLSVALSESYHISHITVDSLKSQGERYKALIIASPSEKFTEKEKYLIDQYIMRGGRTMWLFDPIRVSLDSLERGDATLAFPFDLNLNDQLFTYGARVNPELVQDLQCIQIPIIAQLTNGENKQIPAPWFYSPLLLPAQNHVIGRNLNLVKSEFVSSVEAVNANGDVITTPILTTTKHARRLTTPREVALASVHTPPSRNLFNVAYLPTGLLLEGAFKSPFANRMLPFKRNDDEQFVSQPTKMIVIADGSVIANKVRRRPGSQPTYLRLGYDRFSRKTFGNKEFLVNAINYLCDDDGIMELKARSFKIRLLDKIKTKEQKLKWQILNTLIPVLLFIMAGVVFVVYRRRRYC